MWESALINKRADTKALIWQESSWSDAHKKANGVMGAEEAPTQSPQPDCDDEGC